MYVYCFILRLMTILLQNGDYFRPSLLLLGHNQSDCYFLNMVNPPAYSSCSIGLLFQSLTFQREVMCKVTFEATIDFLSTFGGMEDT